MVCAKRQYLFSIPDLIGQLLRQGTPYPMTILQSNLYAELSISFLCYFKTARTVQKASACLFWQVGGRSLRSQQPHLPLFMIFQVTVEQRSFVNFMTETIIVA